VNWNWNSISVYCNDNDKCKVGPLINICELQKADDKKNWRTLYDCSNTDNSLECETLPRIFDAILAMIIVSAVAIFIVLILMILRRSMNLVLYIWTDKTTHLFFAALALIAGIIGVVVFAVAIPSAYHNSDRCGDDNKTGCKFAGSSETKLEPITENVIYVWGPGVGWIIAVVNLGLMVGFILLYAIQG